MTIDDALALFLSDYSDLFVFEGNDDLFKNNEQYYMEQQADMFEILKIGNQISNFSNVTSQVLCDTTERIKSMYTILNQTKYENENNQIEKVLKDDNSINEKIWSERVSFYLKENDTEKNRHYILSDILNEKSMFYQNSSKQLVVRNIIKENLERIQKSNMQKERYYQYDTKIRDTVYKQNEVMKNVVPSRNNFVGEYITQNFNDSKYESYSDNEGFENNLKNIWNKEVEMTNNDLGERSFFENTNVKSCETADKREREYPIQIFNQFGDINNNLDLDEMIAYLEGKLYEAVSAAAEGVHS